MSNPVISLDSRRPSFATREAEANRYLQALSELSMQIVNISTQGVTFASNLAAQLELSYPATSDTSDSELCRLTEVVSDNFNAALNELLRQTMPSALYTLQVTETAGHFTPMGRTIRHHTTITYELLLLDTPVHRD